MTPHMRFTATIWTFLSLLDEGKQENIDTIWSKIEDGSLVSYLGEKYQIDTTLLTDEDWNEVLTTFCDMQGVNARRKFGVEHNGLALIIALATQGVQQAVSSGA